MSPSHERGPAGAALPARCVCRVWRAASGSLVGMTRTQADECVALRIWAAARRRGETVTLNLARQVTAELCDEHPPECTCGLPECAAADKARLEESFYLARQWESDVTNTRRLALR